MTNKVDQDVARGPISSLALLKLIEECEISHIDSRLIGALSVLYPDALKEAFDQVVDSVERRGR